MASASKTSSKKSDSEAPVKKKKVSGAGARRKGLAFERQIATELGVVFPDAQRELEFQEANNAGTDVEGTDIFQFQCKRWANYCPVGTIEEIRLRHPDNIPVLVTQGNRKECMAVLPFSKLVTLIEIAYGLAPRLVHPDIKKKPAGLKLPNPLLIPARDMAEAALSKGHEEAIEAEIVDGPKLKLDGPEVKEAMAKFSLQSFL